MSGIKWNLEVQTDPLILARTPKLVIINKKKEENMAYLWFYNPSEPQSKNKKNWKEWKEWKVLRHYLRTKKSMDYECDGDTNCS